MHEKVPSQYNSVPELMNPDKIEVIRLACEALEGGDFERASAIVPRQYPFTMQTAKSRRYSELEATRIFMRDGFCDRYSPSRLVFPGALRVLSLLLPNVFPFQENWKMTETHPAYWELFPTIDHIVPVARGGPNTEVNWVTTSMMRNSAKGNWPLDELGWRPYPAGSLQEWDGLLGWFSRYVATNPPILGDLYIRRWYQAAQSMGSSGLL